MSRFEVRKDVFVRCPVAHAFRVFTERVDAWWPGSHRRLTGSRVVLEPLGPEGRLFETDGEKTLEIGFVADWSPPDSVQMGWRLGAPAPLSTVVTISFVAEGEGTRVRVVHVDGVPPLPDFGETARLFDRAWTHVLDAFAASAEES